MFKWIKAWLDAPRCMRCNARLDKYSLPHLSHSDEVECMACGCTNRKPK